MEIRSPITNSNRTIKVGEISTKTIIRRYKRFFQLDVSRFFKNLDNIFIYECLDTGYRFFYPFGLGGDSDFYGYFKNMSWYYMPWKWEHKVALDIVEPGMNVLEIGCAKGDFLKKIKEKNAKAIGLELSKGAAEIGRRDGLDILEESIEDHAKKNLAKYDFICLFQVFEHIGDIGGFLSAMLKALKPGGRIFVSVPNNDSFVGRDTHPSLNLPPHHLGLWNTRSLISLANAFGMQLDNIHYEPLQDYHLAYYYQVNYGDDIINIFGKKVGKFANKLIRPLFCALFKPFAKDITGHTIAATYIRRWL